MSGDNRRYYSLDALRGIMMMLGILLHGSQWYVSMPPGGMPIPTDPSTSPLFDGILHFIHSFRMPLFFLLAGFFTSLLMAKRGMRGTYVNRCKRILAPLLLSAVTILPLTFLFMIGFLFSARFDTWQLLPTAAQGEIVIAELAAAGLPVNQPSLGHLWFLYYLLYFYLLIPVCHYLMHLPGAWHGTVDRVCASPLFVLVLGLFTTLALWPFRGGVLFEGFLFLKPHLPSLVYYGSFFVFGYVFHHHRSILGTFPRVMPWLVTISVVLFPLSIYTTTAEFSATEVTPVIHGLAVVTNAFLTWSLIYVFMGLFLRYLDYDSPYILYISNSSYWVYLFHMPVISFAAWFMLPFDLHAFIKFPIIVLFTTLVCFASYHYLVQDSWVSSLLNGMRFKHPWPWVRRDRPDLVAS